MRNADLVSFLTRPEGHIIASHYGTAIDCPISATINLFKGLYIAISYSINKDISNETESSIFPPNKFGLENTDEVAITNSKLINLNNQCTVAFKFTCIKNKLA